MLDIKKLVPMTRGQWLAAWTLCEREIVRFLRQRHRIIGAVGQPILFWILFASGFSSSFRAGGGDLKLDYGQYFFPGVVVMIVLFTAIFATISIIEDRREGFLQGVLVAPVPRSSILLGKVLGGTALAMIHVAFFLLLAPFAGVSISLLRLPFVIVHLILLGVALTSLGSALAWKMDSTQGYHAIMSVFLIPMWLLSGAFFPADGAPLWLAWIIRLNPLTYGVAGLRAIMTPDAAATLGLHHVIFYELMTIAFAAGMFLIAAQLVERFEGKKA